MTEEPEVWLSAEQVATLLGIKPVTVRAWGNQTPPKFEGRNRLGSAKLGYQVKASSLVKFLESTGADKEIADLQSLLREQTGS